MTATNQLRVAAAVVTLALVGLSRDLAWAWQHSPFDRGAGWLALVWVGWAGWARDRGAGPALGWVLAAVGVGLLSVVAELNVARHLALGLAVAAWVQPGRRRLAVAVGALSWWPALGWALTGALSPVGVLAVRALGLAALVGMTFRDGAGVKPEGKS